MNPWPRLAVALVVATVIRALMVALVPAWSDVLDPFIAATVWIAVGSRPLPGLSCGLVLGLAFDLFSGRPFGLGGFAATLVGYLVSRFAQHLLVRQPRTLVLVFALAIATQRAAMAMLELLLIPDAAIPTWQRVTVTVLATTALGVVWVRAESWLFGRVAGWRRERASKLRLG